MKLTAILLIAQLASVLLAQSSPPTAATGATPRASQLFQDTDLYQAHFRRVTMTNARIEESDLSHLVLRSVDLTDMELTSANLTGAKLRYLKLSGVQITDCDISGMKINGILVTDLLDSYAKSKGR